MNDDDIREDSYIRNTIKLSVGKGSSNGMLAYALLYIGDTIGPALMALSQAISSSHTKTTTPSGSVAPGARHTLAKAKEWDMVIPERGDQPFLDAYVYAHMLEDCVPESSPDTQETMADMILAVYQMLSYRRKRTP